jgi:hypothetical protein
MVYIAADPSGIFSPNQGSALIIIFFCHLLSLINMYQD